MKLLRIKLLVVLLAFAGASAAQGPPQPPGIVHGIGGDQPAGGSAPVGGGVWLLLSLASAYGLGSGLIIYKKNKSKHLKEIPVGITAEK
jgi:hypothetical protein